MILVKQKYLITLIYIVPCDFLFVEVMAAHRVFNAICFLCMYFFLRSSKSEPEYSFDNKFVNKHVWVINKEVYSIHFPEIQDRFNEYHQNYAFRNRPRSKHSFLVAPDLAHLKQQLIEAYKNADKIVDAKGTFTTAKSISLDDLQNIGVIDFKIFQQTENGRYEIKDDTCMYSNRGIFDLGASNESPEKYVINHLAMVNLIGSNECIPYIEDPPSPPNSICKKIKKQRIYLYRRRRKRLRLSGLGK